MLFRSRLEAYLFGKAFPHIPVVLHGAPCYSSDSWFWTKLIVVSALEFDLQRLSAIKVILEFEQAYKIDHLGLEPEKPSESNVFVSKHKLCYYCSYFSIKVWSLGLVFTKNPYCIPRRSRGYLGFSLVTPLHGFFFFFNNLLNILLWSFKFGRWMYIKDLHIKFALGPQPQTNRPTWRPLKGQGKHKVACISLTMQDYKNNFFEIFGP